MLNEQLAATVAVVFVLLAAVHVYWAFGGRAGAAASLPQRPDGTPLFQPSAVMTLAVAVALGAAALLMLALTKGIPRIGPDAVYRYGPWFLGGVLAIRTIGDFRYVGLFKRERASRFASLDTRFYTPLCALLAVAVLYLAGR